MSRDRPLRILVLEHTLADNGAARVTLDRADHWHRAGAQVDLFVVEHSDARELAVPAGVRLHRATPEPRRLRRTVLPSLVGAHRLARRADVVVSGREIGNGLLTAAAVARSARRPLAVTVQSRPDIAISAYVDPKLRTLTRRVLGRVDLAVCVAAGVTPFLGEMGLPEGRIRVVTNGVDVAAVRSAAVMHPDVALPSGPLVVACGRLEHVKGLDVLVRAHALALDGGAPAHALVLVGDGPDAAALQRLADSLGVASTVVLTGFVANPHAIVGRSALLALPSRWEGFPLALVEALCLGTPVVAADCVAGPREVLDGGRLGELVPVEDEQALCAAITAHLRAPDLLRSKAAQGAAEAAVRFEAAAAAHEHLGLLDGLARRRGRTASLPVPAEGVTTLKGDAGHGSAG